MMMKTITSYDDDTMKWDSKSNHGSEKSDLVSWGSSTFTQSGTQFYI